MQWLFFEVLAAYNVTEVFFFKAVVIETSIYLHKTCYLCNYKFRNLSQINFK